MNTPMIRYRILLDDGTVRPIEGYCLIGRGPSLDNITDELDHATDITIVDVDDPSRSLSRTHCALGQFEDTLWVVDLGSNNGTMLVYPNGSTHHLEAGLRYELDPGCVIRVGTHTITVLW